MGEIEGTYRVLETPGSRLGGPNHTGISTLEPGQSLSSAMVKTSAKLQEKDLPIKVRLLDNTTEILHVEPKCYGQILLTEVFKHLNLIESDYFGLEFQNVQSYWIWLEPTKPIIKQVQRPRSTLLRLAVKFFPPDPGQLQEEYTRYLFALQIKRDLVEERMPCSDSTAALLTSHLLQMLVGDYEEVTDREHLKTNKYVPHQDRIQERILENHQKHVGQTPAESDFQVLEIARKLEMYGIRFHLASDREGTKINLAVSHMGVLVFQGNTKINTFNWSKVRKLSFKRKRFLIKLHPEVHGPHQDTLEFLLGSRDECKNFWKICVEYHTFFRLLDQPKPKAKAVFFSRGSSFRYRTQGAVFSESGGSDGLGDRVDNQVLLCAPFDPQSISYTEGSRLPGSPCSSDASFHPGPAADLPPCMDSSRAFVASKAPLAERSSGPSAEEAEQKAGPSRSPPVPIAGLSEDSSQHSNLTSSKSSLNLPPSFQVALSPTGRGSSPLLSPVLGDAGCVQVEEEEETRPKRVPTDKAYFMAKEILATEWTYLKDLEVITVWFRSAVIKEEAMPGPLMALLFSNIDPIYEFHRGFLKEMEQRLGFTGCLQKHAEVLTELEKATRGLKKLETVYQEFELQKVCYLPLNSFLLKPIQRLIYYKLSLARLCKHYPPGHPDSADCQSALHEISEMTARLQSSLLRLENFQKLTELQHDLVGIDNLVIPGREFIREGCLYKLTKKGFQQRMFFLFSDMLLYTSKGVTGTNHFKIHGHLPLHGMLVEESNNEWSVPHCFTIYSVQKTIVVAARSILAGLLTLTPRSLGSAALRAASARPSLPRVLCKGPALVPPSRPTSRASPSPSRVEAPGALGLCGVAPRGVPKGPEQVPAPPSLP
uniref:FERM, ARH/RhoGEF and pleckstrin domain protein 2 n=1 Tax=Monodelphis domestica TaxID=13616 RepID=K7E2N9_MONDO